MDEFFGDVPVWWKTKFGATKARTYSCIFIKG